MMNMNKIQRNGNPKRLLIALFGVITLCLLSCGDGAGGGGGGYSLAGGGIGGSGYSSGPVSSYGSIYSNDIHFDTSRAEIIVEGESLGLGDTVAHKNLKLGQIVRVEGTINDDDTGSAQRIYYDKTLEGPVSKIEILDPFTRRITVLGQVIIADNQTQFVNTDLETLATDKGQVLEVSGYFDSQDAILAAHITKKPGSEQVTVAGTVKELDGIAQSFRVGDLIVDFSAVTAPMPEFNNGDKVRVKGRVNDDTTLKADDLIAWHPLDTRLEAEKIKLEGVILLIQDLYFNLPFEIVVDDVTVRIDADTSFQGMEAAHHLRTGMEVLVAGTLVDGMVHADEIESKYDMIMTSGAVTSLDKANQAFTVDPVWGEFDTDTLVRTNSLTKISLNREKIDFKDISEGDDVIVIGWIRPDDSITAWIVMITSNRHLIK